MASTTDRAAPHPMPDDRSTEETEPDPGRPKSGLGSRGKYQRAIIVGPKDAPPGWWTGHPTKPSRYRLFYDRDGGYRTATTLSPPIDQATVERVIAQNAVRHGVRDQPHRIRVIRFDAGASVQPTVAWVLEGLAQPPPPVEPAMQQPSPAASSTDLGLLLGELRALRQEMARPGIPPWVMQLLPLLGEGVRMVAPLVDAFLNRQSAGASPAAVLPLVREVASMATELGRLQAMQESWEADAPDGGEPARGSDPLATIAQAIAEQGGGNGAMAKMIVEFLRGQAQQRAPAPQPEEGAPEGDAA